MRYGCLVENGKAIPLDDPTSCEFAYSLTSDHVFALAGRLVAYYVEADTCEGIDPRGLYEDIRVKDLARGQDVSNTPAGTRYVYDVRAKANGSIAWFGFYQFPDSDSGRFRIFKRQVGSKRSVRVFSSRSRIVAFDLKGSKLRWRTRTGQRGAATLR